MPARYGRSSLVCIGEHEVPRYAAQERPERLERSGRLIPFLLVSLAAPAARNSG